MIASRTGDASARIRAASRISAVAFGAPSGVTGVLMPDSVVRRGYSVAAMATTRSMAGSAYASSAREGTTGKPMR